VRFGFFVTHFSLGGRMGIVSAPVSALERPDVCIAGHEESGGVTKERDTALTGLACGEQWPTDALSTAEPQLAVADKRDIAHAERERILAEAHATARDILAEAESAAQDILARAVKIKAEADRVLEDANRKAVGMHKRAQAALALAENIAEGRRLIDVLTRGCADDSPVRP
jgi:vacuolar-type H+-ATPase subunit H